MASVLERLLQTITSHSLWITLDKSALVLPIRLAIFCNPRIRLPYMFKGVLDSLI